jgi:hypothetical protein
MASKEFDEKYKGKLTNQDRLLLGKPLSGNKSMLAKRLLVALAGEETMCSQGNQVSQLSQITPNFIWWHVNMCV